MEWLKKRSLKQSFFLISIIFLFVGILLSAAVFLLCINQISKIESYPQYEIVLDGNGNITSTDGSSAHLETGDEDEQLILLLTTLQFILPILLIALSQLLAGITFYRLKIQKPINILKDSAKRIEQQDLAFEVEICAEDELGLLCIAFEKMRRELLHSNQELWHQMEERKRLNAAFSHDLRNPVTVLKGSAHLAIQGIHNKKISTEQLLESLTRMETYTLRIERYVETMSRVQGLEQIVLTKKAVSLKHLFSQLENTVLAMGVAGHKQISFIADQREGTIHLDQDAFFQIAENLVVNALRFAQETIQISCIVSEQELKFVVADDGQGFSPHLIKHGIAPFQKGSEDINHFGMGLYICKLLCQKHGGSLEVENRSRGAAVIASLEIC